jgi:hypothetical protein
MITVEQARALGWQRVEFNDGLGFRPCTAVCAWNPGFQYREGYVRIDLCGAEVTYTLEEAERQFTATYGNALTWYMPGGARIVNTNAFNHSVKGIFRVVRNNQIKFEDLPLGTTLRHKDSALSTAMYEFRGVNRNTGKVYVELRTNDFVRLGSYFREGFYLSPEQSWLALGIDIPKGVVTQRHPNGYWWRIAKLEEGYELV